MELTSNLQNDVEFAKQGDIAAFERLIKSTQNMVSSIALAIVKDFHQSEDITQQVFISTWKNIKSLKNNSSFLPWIRQATRNTAFNALRANKSTTTLSDAESEQLLLQLCNHDLTHEEQVLLKEKNSILNSFLEKLPDDSRDVVLLYYREEQSTQHVATLLEISPENVRQKLTRARRLLKDELLSSFGKVIFSTAPSATFTALVMASLGHSGKAAAATAASHVIATKQTSLLGKFSMLLSGAMLGATLGALATYLGTKPALKRMTEEKDKQKLIKHRNQTIVWVILSGLALVGAYEFGTTYLIIGTYIVFAIGLYYFNKRTSVHIINSLYNNRRLSDKEIRRKKIEQACGHWGLIIGVGSGFAGLIVGLINSGQLVL
ncbi:sigma-70 family RNA polymerase sigma factor [uncultured Psychrosphaera sp.]|uniref:RNA polymerase sigma factor n=1 Tax=uncultured Psychrosphaera sp. TaxID=1403522 RepID=UPI0030F5781F